LFTLVLKALVLASYGNMIILVNS